MRIGLAVGFCRVRVVASDVPLTVVVVIVVLCSWRTRDDALRVVASGVNSLRSENRGVLLITHYQRLLDHVVPDFVHVLARGRIAKSGDKSLALELEQRGYDWVLEVA